MNNVLIALGGGKLEIGGLDLGGKINPVCRDKTQKLLDFHEIIFQLYYPTSRALSAAWKWEGFNWDWRLYGAVFKGPSHR